jgi:hypothetical protein
MDGRDTHTTTGPTVSLQKASRGGTARSTPRRKPRTWSMGCQKQTHQPNTKLAWLEPHHQSKKQSLIRRHHLVRPTRRTNRSRSLIPMTCTERRHAMTPWCKNQKGNQITLQCLQKQPLGMDYQTSATYGSEVEGDFSRPYTGSCGSPGSIL